MTVLGSIYIAGPMRGIKFFNFPAFDAAVLRLAKLGWDPISPAKLEREAGFDETAFADDYDWVDLQKANFNLMDAIDRDVEALKKCHAIYMLDGWENSRGAKAEKALAEWMGLNVLYETEPQQKAATDKLGLGLVLIPLHSLFRVGKVFIEGLRYGRDNWKKGVGDSDYQTERLEHAMRHLFFWKEGDREEDHLAKVAWFCLTQLELERIEELPK